MLEKGIQQVFDELHKFMFEKVYTNPACKSEESKAVEMIQRLYHHFVNSPEKLPEPYNMIAEKDGVEIAACDFIAGMTDRYAVRVFNNLYVPKAWSKTDDFEF